MTNFKNFCVTKCSIRRNIRKIILCRDITLKKIRRQQTKMYLYQKLATVVNTEAEVTTCLLFFFKNYTNKIMQ